AFGGARGGGPTGGPIGMGGSMPPPGMGMGMGGPALVPPPGDADEAEDLVITILEVTNFEGHRKTWNSLDKPARPMIGVAIYQQPKKEGVTFTHTLKGKIYLAKKTAAYEA